MNSVTLSPLALIYDSTEKNDFLPEGLLGLESHGIATTLCGSLAELTQQLRLNVLPSHRMLAVLAGETVENCTVANSLRALYPDLSILALADKRDESGLIRLMQSGVDNTCARDASPALVTAILFRMLARSGLGLPLPASANQQSVEMAKQGRWSLTEQNWVLVNPAGRRIPLTTGERAFLVALLKAPKQRASHADLISAVSLAYDALPETDRRQSRLSVMVSRLRAKCKQHDIDLPLKSVHRWGYMFSGPL